MGIKKLKGLTVLISVVFAVTAERADSFDIRFEVMIQILYKFMYCCYILIS